MEVPKTYYKEVVFIKDRLTARDGKVKHLCSSAFFISKERRFMDNNERQRDLSFLE